jgi:CubicO group peptidase (beta-lactamase class C family)
MLLSPLSPRASCRCACLGIALILGGAAQGHAQGIDEIARSEIEAFRPGLVAALHHEGTLQFLTAYGTRDTTGAPLDADALFPYPALSEVILGMTVEALHAAGLVDQDAPLSRFVPEASPGIGRITLRHLLAHTSGLDDAERVEGESWSRTLDRLDDHALVAEPGLAYSRSRHSYPLAARVLSLVLGRSFVEVAAQAIFAPLGLTATTFDLSEGRARGLVSGVAPSAERSSPTRSMEAEDTVDGLPVVFTNAAEVVTLLSAWTEGRIAGRPLRDLGAAPRITTETDRRFGAGVWIDEVRGLTRASRGDSRFGVSTAFHLFPESGSTVFLWSRGQPSSTSARFLVDVVADVAGAPPRESSVRESSPSREPEAVDAARWAGTYRNGHLILVLRESGGHLVLFDGSRELALDVLGGGRIAARLPDGRVAIAFELVADGAGRRYVYYNALLYRHEADPLRAEPAVGPPPDLHSTSEREPAGRPASRSARVRLPPPSSLLHLDQRRQVDLEQGSHLGQLFWSEPVQ